VPQPAELPPSQERKPEREGPRPLPRPGFAGGTADMRADEPRKPDLS
jgi:hypothetical protein